MVIPTSFTIQGGTPFVMNKDDQYKHLGVPTGYSSFISIESSAEDLGTTISKFSASLLTPWQKFEAPRTFILPKLSFILKSGYVTKKVLKVLDQKITEVAKDWTAFPRQASTELFYLPGYVQKK